MKALLLAAGLGSRLRPLTLHRPKPLCLFYGKPLLDLVYRQIVRSGIKSVAINTHHLAEQISQHVRAMRDLYTKDPQLSYEPEILGTGGCINPLRSWIGKDHLLIFNADIIADVDLKALLSQHQESKALATMVLLPQLKAGTTPILWDGHRQIRKIGGLGSGEQATFAGIHIVSPQLMETIPRQGFQHIIDVYQVLLKQGERIEAFVHDGFWADLGTPEDYIGAHRLLLRSDRRDAIGKQLGLDSKIQWLDREQSACVDQPFKGQLEDSFIFGPLETKDVQSIRSCIVYPRSPLQGRSAVNRLIITPDAELCL